MDQFLKSVTRLGWAASLLGVQQLQKTLEPLSTVGRFGTEQSRLTPDEILKYLRDHAATNVSKLFALDSFTPRSAMRAAIEMLHGSADIFKNITPPGSGQIAWGELQNKLQSFYLFEHVDSVLDISPNARPSLPELLNRASRLGSFFSVWATEGIGHYYCDWHFAQGQDPFELLSATTTAGLPAASMLPLHAGMGLSLAEAALSETSNSRFGIDRLIGRFLDLCQNNAGKGFLGETLEALGLACRNLYPHLIAPIDRQLVQLDEVLLAYFWHGIGRAIYFTPTNFPPFRNAPWTALQTCLEEPPHGVGRRNTVAGFVWALTLVNMRQPEVMATFLDLHEKDIISDDAFTNGISSAVIAWHDSAPGDEDLDWFRRYEPTDDRLAELWNEYIEQTCCNALRYHKAIAQQRTLGEIFRYQNLSKLVSTLENRQESSDNFDE